MEPIGLTLFIMLYFILSLGYVLILASSLIFFVGSYFRCCRRISMYRFESFSIFLGYVSTYLISLALSWPDQSLHVDVANPESIFSESFRFALYISSFLQLLIAPIVLQIMYALRYIYRKLNLN